MNAFEAPEIPQAHIKFAKAVAAVANEHGMNRFSMTYRPDFISSIKMPSMLRGELKINYSAADGRGRPYHNLKIVLDSSLTIDIVSTPESCS